MTLGLYFAKRFFFSFLLVLAIFFALLLLIDFVEQMRFFGSKSVTVWQTLGLALFNVPFNLHRILPLVMLVASILALLGLSKSNELIIARSVGLSWIKILIPPVATAFLIGMSSLALFNPIIAISMSQYDSLWASYARGVESTLSVSSEGFWLRQGNSDGQTVIKATRTNSDGTTLYGTSFWTFDVQGAAVSRIEASSAILETGAWSLSQARQWDLRATNPQAVVQRLKPDTKLPTDLTPSAIRDSFGKPASISIWLLPDYILELERAGFSARNYRVWLQMELALPFLLSSMVLLAACFTMRHTRRSASGILIVCAVLSGFGVYFLRNFTQLLGETGQIPITLAAWAPPTIATLCALGLLLHLEES
jgi:lipopolysaccharide export system permease protein